MYPGPCLAPPPHDPTDTARFEAHVTQQERRTFPRVHRNRDVWLVSAINRGSEISPPLYTLCWPFEGPDTTIVVGELGNHVLWVLHR